MKLLAINSSEKQAEISLLNENEKIIYKLEEGKSHSEYLLLEIENLLERNNLKIQDIDSVCVNVGPGSFTGIRIGISFVKAFMLALKINVVTVSNFEIVSYNILDKPKEYFVILPSNSSDVYYCKFKENSREYGFIKIEALKDILTSNSVYCVDADFNKLNLDNLIKVKIVEDSFLNLSIEKVNLKEYKEINEINPLYIKKSQAEEALQSKIDENLIITNIVKIEELINLENKCFEDDSYSEKLLKEDLNNDNRKIYVAKLFDEVIGYINFEVVLDEINLLKICVLKEFRGYNIASKLMQKMVEYKNQHCIKKIFLEVSNKNIPAIKLYEKFNFKLLTTRKNYYKSGEDAYIFVLE